MARQSGFQLENNFTKGLITEATGLNFPENACTETFDCVLSEKGRATRRLGFDYEGNSEFKIINRTNSAIVEYVWNAAGGTGSTDIVVVQIGSTLYYYEAAQDESLSSNIFAFTTDLLDFEVGTSTDVAGNICQFASGNGFLFVVHPLCEPFYVSFDPSGPSITEAQITITARDLDGDKNDPNYNDYEVRPTVANNAHKYNLYNQGWYFEAQCGAGSTTPDDAGMAVVYTFWDGLRADFPSNGDIWWLHRDPSNRFNLNWIDRGTMGNRPAPKGHYTLNEFDTNRATLSGIVTGVTERDSGGQRPSTVAFFTSRVWYSGVSAPEYNQKIYYSQIIEGTENFGKCYQVNDPTSSEISDLLPSDGGVIAIPDVGEVIKLFPMANSLIVFATNGVWAISGSEGIGFKATDYSIRKISSIESLSPLSFVDVYGSPLWWTADGIYTVSGDSGMGNEGVTSLTDDTIKQFLLDIPSEAKPFVKGQFNPRSKIVQWLYRSTSPADIESEFSYDRILNLNVLSKAFYPWTISSSATSPMIHGFIVTRGPVAQGININVLDGTDQVIDSNGDIVVVSGFGEIGASFSFRYFTTTNIDADEWNATWSQTLEPSYLDWVTEDEDLDYSSYFFTGHKVHGDAIRFFENNYLTITMSTEDDASCFIQGVWDYANSPSSARFTNPQQVYTNKLLRDIQQTRKKIRGRGRSLHYKFYSETGKPFTIHGWSAWETQNASV